MYQLKGKSEDLDGVMVFNADGKPLAFIKLPERLRQSLLRRPEEQPPLYGKLPLGRIALYVEAHGAV